MDNKLDAGTLSVRLFFLSLPLMLNDFYLPLVPQNAIKLDLILDIIIYIGWQTSIIYFAYQAKWFEFKNLGLSGRDLFKEIMFGIVLFLGIFVVSMIVTFAGVMLEKKSGVKIPSAWYFPLPAWKPFPAFLYAVYISATAGIFEEFIYRGIVITQLRQFTGSKFSQIIISAILFTAIHWSLGPATWIIAFLFGILWAYLFILRGSLLPIMISHFLFDVVSEYKLDEVLLKKSGLI